VKKILHVISIVLLVAGVGLVAYSIFEIFQGEQQVNEARAEAKEIIKKNTELQEEGEVFSVDDISFEQGETIGLLYIPKLDRDLPIIQGTDPEELERGVGHYNGTAYPLQNDQIVLSGHRDTVFRNFDQLEIGDTFVVQLPYGDFEYEIYETEIVDADDTTVIGSTTGENLTVTTCYPFSYIGDAPYRFIFYSKLVQ
jgi:sortase A